MGELSSDRYNNKDIGKNMKYGLKKYSIKNTMTEYK